MTAEPGTRPAPRSSVPLSTLTTLGVGGPARHLLEATSNDQLISAVTDADRRGEPVLILGGGSNLVVGDGGFDGLVVVVRTRGIFVEGPASDVDAPEAGTVAVTAAAGQPWDDFVQFTLAAGLAGTECLSGIPGTVGATPLQNVGAYGQEVADTITAVHIYDRKEGTDSWLAHDECDFAYRSSRFKGADRWVVLAVRFRLTRGPESRPVRYAELARRLEIPVGGTAPVERVREAVLALRRGKGMVTDPSDPDSASAGSFFMNPLLTVQAFEAVRCRATERLGAAVEVPTFPAGNGTVKVPAAWLIEQAGFVKGYGHGPARISSKHTLALTNRGGATATQVLALAAEIRDGVRERFGVTLHPEPLLVGVSLPD